MLNSVCDEANADAEDGSIHYQCFRHNANLDTDVNVMYVYDGPLAIEYTSFNPFTFGPTYKEQLPAKKHIRCKQCSLI